MPQHRPPPYALVGGFESSFDDEDMDDPAAAYDFSNGGQLSEASSRHSSGRISERAPADAVEAEAEEGEEEEYEEEEAGAYGQAMPYDMGAHYDAAGYGAALQPHYAAAAAHAAAAAAAAAAGGGVLATSGRAQKRAWTQEEDAIILDGVKTFGHKWSKITERLPVSAAHRHAARRPPTRRPPPVTRGTPETLTVPLFPTLRCRAPTIPSATAGSACCASRRSRGSRRAAPTATARPPWRRRVSTTAAAAAARTRAAAPRRHVDGRGGRDGGARLEGLRWRGIAARFPGAPSRAAATAGRARRSASSPPPACPSAAPRRSCCARAASLMPAKRQRVDSGARAHNPPPVVAAEAARPPSAYV